MSENIPNLFTTQFSTNLQMKLQQVGSKLRGKTMEGAHVGKQASPIQYMNAIAMRAPAGRFAPLNRVDTDFTRRWVFPQDGELPQLIDSFDELRTIIDPKSQYVANAAAAVGRAWDDCLIAAAFGTAQIGTDAGGLSGETFDTTKYQVASTFGSGATASGLTVPKLIELRRIFRHNHVDFEVDPITLVVGSQQESDLLNAAQVVSTEFKLASPTDVDGRVTRILGFDIVYSERLSSASNVRNCIAFAKTGLYFGVWKDIYNRVSQRNDLSSEPYQVYTAATFGATRLEPGRTLSVLCADTTTAADITP